jgi:hypothetical protein
MTISSQELSELKSRVLVAMRTGTNIARVSDYLIALIREAGSSLPERPKGNTDTEYLYSVILAVEGKKVEPATVVVQEEVKPLQIVEVAQEEVKPLEAIPEVEHSPIESEHSPIESELESPVEEVESAKLVENSEDAEPDHTQKSKGGKSKKSKK